jgi:hypothetical protein
MSWFHDGHDLGGWRRIRPGPEIDGWRLPRLKRLCYVRSRPATVKEAMS